MEVRLTVRLLDAENRLLGWTDLLARMPGDGTLRADGPSPILIERAGIPVWISVHWPDAHVEVRTPAPTRQPVALGQTYTVSWSGPVIVLGLPPVDLPMVTHRQPVQVSPPCGNFGSLSGHLDLTSPMGG